MIISYTQAAHACARARAKLVWRFIRVSRAGLCVNGLWCDLRIHWINRFMLLLQILCDLFFYCPFLCALWMDAIDSVTEKPTTDDANYWLFLLLINVIHNHYMALFMAARGDIRNILWTQMERRPATLDAQTVYRLICVPTNQLSLCALKTLALIGDYSHHVECTFNSMCNLCRSGRYASV